MSRTNESLGERGAPSPVHISTRGLDLYYGSAKVLKSVTFDIYRNTVTAFIGPSGCGKSSCLRCFNRMNDFISGARVEGTVEIDGHDIYAPATDVIGLRRRVGMVFQKPNPFPMSIYDNVAYGPRLFGVRDRDVLDGIVRRSLEWSALWEEVCDKLGSSGTGVGRPAAEALHRPCHRHRAGDPAHGRAHKRLGPVRHPPHRGAVPRKERFTVVTVTHNMRQAARISDRTAFFLVGELIEYGDTARIFTSPKERRTIISQAVLGDVLFIFIKTIFSENKTF